MTQLDDNYSYRVVDYFSKMLYDTEQKTEVY